jgi:D-serine deaminase-like pyridoxal phosphate-dependent protein
MNEEHTQLKSIGADLEIGQKIELIPAHICPTINLHDYIHVIKNNEYCGKWAILARGKNY